MEVAQLVVALGRRRARRRGRRRPPAPRCGRRTRRPPRGARAPPPAPAPRCSARPSQSSDLVALLGGSRLVQRAAAAGAAPARTSPPGGPPRPARGGTPTPRRLPSPGAARRCWATAPGSSPVDQRIRAARACSSPAITSGSSASTAARSRGCRNSTGSPCANTLATSSRAASPAATASSSRGQLGGVPQRAPVTQDGRRLRQGGRSGAELAEPPGHRASQREGAVDAERLRDRGGRRARRTAAARSRRTALPRDTCRHSWTKASATGAPSSLGRELLHGRARTGSPGSAPRSPGRRRSPPAAAAPRGSRPAGWRRPARPRWAEISACTSSRTRREAASAQCASSTASRSGSRSASRAISHWQP